MSDAIWDRLRSELREIIPSNNYYAVTLLGDEKGQVSFYTRTQWGGWADEARTREIREPSFVHPQRAVELWDRMDQPYLVVNSEEHYSVYCLLGGNALIVEDVAHWCLGKLMDSEASARTGRSGFARVKSLPEGELKRAPNPKKRMHVLNRDGSRCRICGQSPDDDVNVVLHVHHIRPWARGGLTEEKNLITLCHTCHRGLDPHEDSSLFDYVDPLTWRDLNREFWQGLLWYRNHIKQIEASDPDC